MKTKTMKTKSLEGAALDWAVAQAIGLQVIFQVLSETIDTSTQDKPSSIETVLGAEVYYHRGDMSLALYSPSTDWSQGGPLIERNRVRIVYSDDDITPYAVTRECHPALQAGDTVLVAAMRAIVSANLGDTVEVPAELAGTHP